MNQLNSIIVEGCLVSAVFIKDSRNMVKGVECVMSSNRCFKSDRGRYENWRNIFKFIAYGQLARGATEILKEGTIVRVVGRLESNDMGNVYIVAEHIEAKPIENK